MVAPRQTNPTLALLDELLAEQARLQTPVARAATILEAQPEALRGERWRDLLPLTAPRPGEQYAFQVDLDACTGCKACVSACHSLNGLDETETWRDVGCVIDGDRSQTITTACHHCEDPACLNGCPVLAYEKDPLTGIVRHLDDQCIGCSYCVLKCPYDVPKFNDRLGIVRKCDLCHGRLAEGEAPACAQACPTHAITIVTVPLTKSQNPNPKSQTPALNSQLSALSSTDSAYTRPTTRYVSKEALTERVRAADADALRVQPAHAPLVAMLTLTQLGLGLMLAGTQHLASPEPGDGGSTLNSQLLPAVGLALFTAGLIASVFHLGQPLRAWRIFLNLRRSWLSREAVLLGAAFPLLAASVVAASASEWLADVGLPISQLSTLNTQLFPLGLALAVVGVACSAMLYVDTRRRFWRAPQSFGRMAGTVAIAALAFTAPLAAASVLVAKLALELSTLRGASTSARLQRGPLRAFLIARLSFATVALLLWPLASGLWSLSIAAAIAFALGELAERTLFFRAVDAPKMPGVAAA